MRDWRLSITAWALGTAVLLGSPFAADAAPASSPQSKTGHGPAVHAKANTARAGKVVAVTSKRWVKAPSAHTPLGKATAQGNSKNGRHALVRGRGISCVPFARAATGIAVFGNAWQWWANAAGQYARGQVPEAGSILAFRSNSRMPMGHVAVVSKLIDSRQIAIDHANWPVGGYRGAVSRNMTVVDVSERNDWSAVRLALGHGDTYGSVYPTHGFIYGRDDNGKIRMANERTAPLDSLNPPPNDLRPEIEQSWAGVGVNGYEQVAEAPVSRATRRAPITGPRVDRAPTTPIFNGGN